MDNDNNFYRKNIITATNIIGDMLEDESQLDLSETNIRKIEMNIQDPELKIFKKRIHLIITYILDNDKMVKNMFSLAEKKVLTVLLKFLVDPVKFIGHINYKMINPYDQSNQKLKLEIVKLCISFVGKSLVSYSERLRHMKNLSNKKRTLIFNDK